MSLRDSNAAADAIQRLQGLSSGTPSRRPFDGIPMEPDQPGYKDRINITATPDEEIVEMDVASGLPLDIVQPRTPAPGANQPLYALPREPVEDKRVVLTFARDPKNVTVSVVSPALDHIYARAIIDGVSLVSLYPVLEQIVSVVDLAGVREVFGAADGEDARRSPSSAPRGAEDRPAGPDRPDEAPTDGATPARGPTRRRSRRAADSAG